MTDRIYADIQDAWLRIDHAATALRALHVAARQKAEQAAAERLGQIEAQRLAAIAEADATRSANRAELDRAFESSTAAVARRIGDFIAAYPRALADWEDHFWRDLDPAGGNGPEIPLTGLRLGILRLDLEGLVDVPAVFPLADLDLIVTAGDGDEDAARNVVENVALRLVSMLPPGRAHLSLIDPLGHGTRFNGFLRLHANDRTEKVLWSPEDIERRVDALNQEIEEVIQRRLGNLHPTLAAYNDASPGQEIPYRVLALVDFPAGFSERALHRLATLLRVGKRAGLVLLMHRSPTTAFPERFDPASLPLPVSTLEARSDGTLRWQDSDLGGVEATADRLPSPQRMNVMIDAIATLREQARGQVTFTTIRPAPAEQWQGSSLEGVRVPIGLSEQGDSLWFTLGHGRGQHALIGGDTQQGKTTLLHVLINQIAMTYAPDEAALYLLDFKGPEFQPYVTHALPHARVVALKSDPEFGLSTLRQFQREIDERDRLFRQSGVARLVDYRQRTDAALPRIIAILDEVHVLFEHDRWAGDGEAARVLEDVAKRGAAFGVHLVVATQSPASGNLRAALAPVYEQMGLRIALPTREAHVGEAILGEGNRASSELTDPGTVVLNDAGGRLSHNLRGRIANLQLAEREAVMAEIAGMSAGRGFPPPASFSGDEPATISSCGPLRDALADAHWPEPGPDVPLAWLGEPVGLGPAIAVPFERYLGANLLVAGEEAGAHGLLAAAVLSLAAQLPPDALAFDVFDFARPASPFFGLFGRIAEVLPHQMAVHGPRAAGEALDLLGVELARRRDEGEADAARRVLVVTGLHRWRDLQAAGYQPSPSGKQLGLLLDEGPDWGIHTIAWIDGIARGNALLRHFDLRAAFLLTEDESSDLFDSRIAASRLRPGRALYRQTDWAAGRTELFKPLAVPDKIEMDHTLQSIADRRARS